MSRSTFRVLFYLKRNAPKKNGLVPVMCRITVNGKISQFSCKLDIEEKLWNVNLGRMSGRSVVAQESNRMPDKIRVGINKAYQEIQTDSRALIALLSVSVLGGRLPPLKKQGWLINQLINQYPDWLINK